MSEKQGDGESKAKRSTKTAKSAKPAKASAKSATSKPRAKRAPAKSRRARAAGADEESPATLRESPRALAQAVREPEEEISIPPTSSDEIDEGDERFFQAGEAAVHEPLLRAPVTPLAVEVTEQQRSFVNPSFRERQQRLQRYVKIAVGFSAAVCLAALVRLGVEHLGHTAGESTAAAAEGPSVAMVAGERVPAPSLAPQQVVVPAPVAAAPVAAPVPDPPAAPAKSAADEKKDARVALERFKLADAIAAGQRSVAIDPTDAEAWLILGAAYQESGKPADAHRAFDTCVHSAKRGAVNECVALR